MRPNSIVVTLYPIFVPMSVQGPIGIFDSGFGGLTVLNSIRAVLPDYDYLYLGDSARTPYGTRSFESVYEFTWEGVKYLFDQGCSLVILACNTAAAKALRSIQQKELPLYASQKRVLGVLRPTTETIGSYSQSGNLGIVGTPGTVTSKSYLIEIERFFPELRVYQQACPMWVPLVENGEHLSEGAVYFVEKDLNRLFERNASIDTLLLACTHYPLLAPIIEKIIGDQVQLVSQGPIVARSLQDYLKRHPEVDDNCSQTGSMEVLTTEDHLKFESLGSQFFGAPFQARHVHL